MVQAKQQYAILQKKHGQPYHVIKVQSADEAFQGATEENRFMPKEWRNIMSAHPVQWDEQQQDWIQITE